MENQEHGPVAALSSLLAIAALSSLKSAHPIQVGSNLLNLMEVFGYNWL